ncbi:MAG: response regulator [Candidatus Magnetoovum sp. WYHC-5]|nr:response regulator [Candidatus Magnetoovum sp. WYHC-5]
MPLDKILILEDEQIVINAIQKHLKTENYTILTANNGVEGLKVYYEERPILIILDLKMPVMDGIEFLEEINITPSSPCSVIVLTGHGSDEDMERCFELGVYAFLHKPFNAYELKGLVRHCIALKHVEQNLKKEVAQRTKMEEELWKYRYLLEDIVEKRTEELKGTNDKLQKEITERKNTEEKLKKTIKEKDMLLVEIHHRVKNNLQIISSLIDLQSKYVTDEQTKAMFVDSQARLRTMALIHEKLYQSEDIINVDFHRYVRSLSDYLYHSYCLNKSNVSMDINVESVFLDVDTAVPCGIIINELVTNSLKHAFPPDMEGKISIEMKRKGDGYYHLKIYDNGKGMGDVDLRQTTSLGLRLVYALTTEQLRGSVSLEKGEGTTFDILFKDAKQNGGEKD